jgi:hypothetical protein
MKLPPSLRSMMFDFDAQPVIEQRVCSNQFFR